MTTTIERVTLDTARELDAFVMSHPKCHYMQTSIYGRSRPDYNWEGLILRNADGTIRATMALQSKCVSHTKYKLFYSPRGPICSTVEEFNDMIAAATKHCKKQNGYLLRIDPAFLETDDAFRANAEKLGFYIDPRDDYSTFIARKVYVTDLEGETEESLMAKFHSKTRYNIRLSQRRGCVVREGTLEDVPVFTEMMRQTGGRDGFHARSEEHYRDMLTTFGEHTSMILAEKDGKILAGVILLIMGGKAWYVYGCSFNEGRENMPNFLLQWEMIRRGIAAGCRIYDFRGVEGEPVPENPHYGLHRFKQGFNARFVEYIGQMDLVLNPTGNKLINTIQKVKGLLRR